MKKIFEGTFYDYPNGNFFEYIDKIILWLEKNDKDYRENCEEEEKLLDKYPRVRKVLDDRKALMLSKDESETIITIIDLRKNRQETLFKKMFFEGSKEAYYYFKKIGVLKESDTE